jgi:hypothetical protein
MTEVLFILVTIYVAYVVYTTVNDKPVASSNEVELKQVNDSDKPVVEAKSPEKKPENPIKVAVAAKSSDELKNPKTGEISKIPNNYRFGKRWIKDALVTEGLLDKVYKNNELDDATNDKVQAALEALKAMEKYQA